MKPIKDYEDLYSVTSCGKVWSHRSKKFLKLRKTNSGYLQVVLYKNGGGRNVYVHRLVADAYLLPPKDMIQPEVDHIDGNKEHNYINNLQWLSHDDNVKKGCGKAIRCVETGKVYPSIRAAARDTGICDVTIGRALQRTSKTGGGYHWEAI